ncbi:dipeptide/oligopeptide/nickel ABC transporter permease/ATP-binding protein [Georgenia halophila]|uniref:Dipeptide/oligopeptide/nickel ABC transporter permease/ATP-binding protein n=1 Tax=Georgenia halophila TaxID=620889 RepID=A0ABP8KSM1_9MICO
MSDTSAAEASKTVPAAVAASRESLTRTLLRNTLGRLALITLALIVLISVIGPIFAPYGANQVRIELVNAPVGSEYILGGDGAGRDILSRLMWSGRNTLLGAAIAVAIALVIGATSGLIAGYFGKWFDTLSSWAANIVLALPAMIVLLALYPSLGGSMFAAMAVFGVMLSPSFFRLVRNQVIAVKNELYVDAARVSGLPDRRIISRHVFRVVRSPVIIQTAIISGIAIIIQSGLEFLGLGDPSTPTWGAMLQDAFQNIYVQRTSILWPGIMISATVASLVLFGNALRDEIQGRRVAGVARTRPAAATESTKVPSSGALLEVDDLRIGYGPDENPTVVVRSVNFSLRKGEILGIVGESGSGKTQTAFSILGLLPRGGRVLGGEIFFRGTALTRLGAKELAALRGGEIAYIPQEPMSNLDPSFTIGHQLVEPMQAVLGISSREARGRALDLLSRVGIPDPPRTFAAYPHQISGGMAQRVLIAGAISCKPSLLIADEPTTALDVTVQAEILELLRELQDELAMGVVLVTHNFGVVADICERVVVMQNGCDVETNEVQALFDAPQDDYTQMLMSSTLDDAPPRGALVHQGEAR